MEYTTKRLIEAIDGYLSTCEMFQKGGFTDTDNQHIALTLYDVVNQLRLVGGLATPQQNRAATRIEELAIGSIGTGKFITASALRNVRTTLEHM